MINRLLDFLGRLALLIFLLGSIIGTCYLIIFLGVSLIEWLQGFM